MKINENIDNQKALELVREAIIANDALISKHHQAAKEMKKSFKKVEPVCNNTDSFLNENDVLLINDTDFSDYLYGY